MYILLVATAIAIIMMLVCKSKPASEHFETPYLTQSDYPRLIYNQQPYLPPGSTMGLNFFPPAPAPTFAQPMMAGTDQVVPIDATLDTPNPIYLAGQVNWNINL